MAAAVAGCSASAGDGGGGGGGAADAGGGGGGGGPDACAGADCGGGGDLTPVVFMFDQTGHTILRLEDKNGDGDAVDTGEVTLFFDNDQPLGVFNSMGMVALGPDELLACDNITSVNTDSDVVHLSDKNGDGDALDPDEAALWWTGALPGGGALTFPVAIERGPDGAYYAAQNDFSDDKPDAIYRLSDESGDGDVDDPGEATIDFDLASVTPTPQILDLTFDAAGRAYAVNIRNPDDPNDGSVVMLTQAGVWSTLVDSAQLFTMTQNDEGLLLPPTSSEVGYLARTDEVVVATTDLGTHDHLAALHDTDGNGSIGPGELRVVWSSNVAVPQGYSGLRDFTFLPDGSALVTDGGQNKIWRLTDRDGDGRLDGPGETTIYYDADAAAAAGMPAAQNAFTTAVWVSASGGSD